VAAVRIKVRKLIVAGLGLGSDHRERCQRTQGDDKDCQGVPDNQIGNLDPEALHRNLLKALGLSIRAHEMVGRLERPEDRPSQPGQQDGSQRE